MSNDRKNFQDKHLKRNISPFTYPNYAINTSLDSLGFRLLNESKIVEIQSLDAEKMRFKDLVLKFL